MDTEFTPNKRMRAINSVFFKLAVSIIVAVGISGLALVSLSLRGSNKVVDQLTAAGDQEITALVADALVGSFQMMNVNGINRRLEPMVDPEDPNAPSIIALAANGRDLTRLGPEIDGVSELERLAEVALETGERQLSQDGLFVAQPVMARGNDRLLGVLAIAWNAEGAHALVLSDQMRTAAFSSGIFIMALIAIMFGVRRFIMNPLRDIGGAVGQIARKNYEIDIPVSHRNDEMGRLATSLQEFAGELGKGARAEAENRFRSTAFQGASTCLMMMDDTLTISAVNPAMQDLMDKLQNDCASDLTPGGDELSEYQSFEQFLCFSSQSDIVDQLVAATDLPCEILLSVSEMRLKVLVDAVRDTDNCVIGYVAEWQDITDRFVNEALMRAINDNQIKVDLATDGTVLAVNPHFTTVMKHEANALENVDFATMFAGDEDGNVSLSEVIQRLNGGATLYGHFRLIDQHGDAVIVDGGFVPVTDLDGTLMRIVMIANDVTDVRREVEAAEAERAAMEAAQSQVVDALRDGLSQLSAGDLTTVLSDPFSENYEQLRHDFNQAAENLLSAMRGVVENADLIQGEALEISNAADDLSQRTERQAATLEETATALDELTSSVRSAADGASHANEVVDTARENAEASGEVVREAVEAMGEIKSSSQQISKITGVIDDIAFQTNLLALNAGVEAARAGDAGRGFAVVASEVRALAQRSSDAAREINELISASGTQVKRGVQLVDQAGAALAGIVESVSEISRNVGEIAVSSREQSAGLAEINQAVNQLDQVTQQNAAMFEQTTAASHALNREAETLNKTMGRFNIGNRESSGADIIDSRVFVKAQTDQAAQSTPVITQPPTHQTSSQNTMLALREEPAFEDDDDGWDDF